MDDLGPPIAYVALPDGVRVYTADGQEIGRVEHVLADEEDDIFDGLVVDARLGPGGLRFVDASQVERLHERGVVLTLDAAQADRLPDPAPQPGVLRVDPADADESELSRKLRRAWDLISGNY
jgi:hypothetical protein